MIQHGVNLKKYLVNFTEFQFQFTLHCSMMVEVEDRDNEGEMCMLGKWIL